MSTHNFSNYRVEETTINVSQSTSGTYIARVFLWMFAALGISAVFAFLFASSPALLSYLVHYNPMTGAGGPTLLGWVVMLAPLGFVLTMNFAFQRLSFGALVALFMAYSALNGISFSFILLTYTAGSVLSCFLSAAVMFGIMAVMGFTTKKDLTSFGRLLSMGLIGILVAMLINFFLKSSGLDYLISIIGVGVFVGLTAWDVQKLKQIGAGVEYGEISALEGKKIGVLGALTLYLDFINIFLFLLRLFGSRRD